MIYQIVLSAISFPLWFNSGILAASLKPSPLVIEAPQSLEFLRKYGYLNGGKDGDTDSPVELLFSQESVETALKQAQRFGGIKQSGKLDDETKKLFKSRRCGLPDITKNFTEINVKDGEQNDGPPPHHHHHHHHNHNHRNKRYVLASNGWNKRRLTYYIENWSPLMNPEEVKREIRKALSVWGKSGQLTFTEVSDPRDSDINFGFYVGDHGDSYAFDGPGLVLAHAFFPSSSVPLRGDVHFDGEEIWKINPGQFEDAVDFSTVLLHELGHSLGLSHSPEKDSVMNPYYFRKRGFELGYDDILAMHELYVSRHIPDQDDRYNGGYWPHWQEQPRYRPNYWPPRPPMITSTTPRYYPITKSTTTSTTTMAIPTNDNRSDEYDIDAYDKVNNHPRVVNTDYEGRRKERPSKDEPSKDDDGCKNIEGGIDSASFIRGELFITKGEKLWRLSDAGKVETGYPIEFLRFFHKLPETVKVIDAMYERPDSSIVFFYDKQYWIFDGYDFIEGSPRNIKDYGLNTTDEKVDAALYSTNLSATYIFSGEKYWKFNETSKTVAPGYPKYISNIKGSPAHLNAALIDRNGEIYIFKDDTYWTLDLENGIATKTGSVFKHWLSC